MAIAHLACLDGVVSAAVEARVPATDDGLLRGDGAFEVMRLYDNRPYALEAHLARLERSAANLRLPLDRPALEADVGRLLAVAAADPSAPADGCLRIVVTRGGRRLLLVESPPQHVEAIRLATVTYSPPRLLDGIKSLSYAANMLATRIAQEQDADEALLVTPHGRVLEAPTSSFFWVADGTLRTPPLSDHILASITRALVLDVAAVEERPCTLEDLRAAQEAFLASTTREVQAIASVDGTPLPVAPGPVTQETARRVRERMADELA